jgi:plasmid stabilization system protein ParE
MMIRFSSEALADLDNHLEYYGDQSLRTQQQFWGQLQEALRLIAQYPTISPQVKGEVRRFILRQFSVACIT